MKTALITGCAKRMGLEMAKFLASKGYNIAMHCNNSVHLATTEANAIEKKYGVRCEVFSCDLAKIENIETLFEKIILSFKKIDILINNASFFEKSSIMEISKEKIMENFAVHYFSPLLLAKAFALQKNLEDGIIINMLDKNITRNQTSYFAYLHSKKSLFELTKYLAVELAPKIRTNAISPGFIIEEDGIVADEKYINQKLQSIPMQKKGNTENIISALEFILNNDYINGQNIFVDGGSFLLK